MIQTLSEKVSVVSSYNHRTQEVKPMSVSWGGRIYPVLKVGLRHTYREGSTRYHVFSVIAHSGNTESLAKLARAKWDPNRDNSSLFFKLILDTETLHWTVSEVSDGLPD